MDEIYSLRKQASSLRKKESYKESAEIYEKIWQNFQDSINEWDGWGFAYCLRKIGNSEKALTLCEEVNQRWPKFEPIHNLLAWCIYDFSIIKSANEIKQSEGKFWDGVNRIISLTTQNIYSPFARTIFKVVDYLEESQNNFPADAIGNWIDKLDPLDLSLKTWQGKDQRGKPMEHASDREKWYSKKIKVLYSQEKFHDCINTGKKALEIIPAFHYQNEKWIKRWIALSYGELGEFKKGISWLDQIIDQRAEWFIYFYKAKLLEKLGDLDQALKFCSIAALERQYLGYKCNVFFLMGKIFLKKDDRELAYKHLLLAAKIREEEEWSIPDELKVLINQNGINLSEQITSKELAIDLTNCWQSMKYLDMDIAKGKIKNIVRSGKSGFISGDDGKEYYFRVREFDGNPKSLEPGKKVVYYIQRSADSDKLDVALRIKLI